MTELVSWAGSGVILVGGLLWALMPAITSVWSVTCNGRCRKGAPDPRCPLHGKGGRG